MNQCPSVLQSSHIHYICKGPALVQSILKTTGSEQMIKITNEALFRNVLYHRIVVFILLIRLTFETKHVVY